MVKFSVKRSTPATTVSKNKKRFELAKIPKSLGLFVMVMVVVGAYGAYRYANRTENVTTDPTPIAQETQKIDYSPATETDKADVDERKANLANNNSGSNGETGERKTVTPIIVGSSTSPVSVRSYVSGVIESGGICTLNLTNGSTTVTADGTASAGAQTTDCPELTVTPPSSGTWKATISYLSATSQGTSSQDWEITIQ